MKKWETINKVVVRSSKFEEDDIIKILLKNRGLKTKKQIDEFLTPPDPQKLTAKDVGINPVHLKKAISRIQKAIKNKESVVVYTDYDADGITGGAILWETLYKLGSKVMPYIPHRVEEGYGLSLKGIDNIIKQFQPKLIITVDHGITAREKVKYAKSQNIDVIVTDHHVKPQKLPECLIVHTIKLSGAGVAYFLAKELISRQLSLPAIPIQSGRQVQAGAFSHQTIDELLVLATVGTIADLVPLTGSNRAIVKHGLEKLNQTQNVGLTALIKDAGLEKNNIDTYSVSHILAPRLNAMGRLVHGLDALRLLCTNKKTAAEYLAQKLGLTNKERQQLTEDTTMHALNSMPKSQKKLIFLSHKEYNQGVIGLVAGKLTEIYYRPAIVVSRGEIYSKASARSISGFNIIKSIRFCSELLVDAGGHPMAAGFTVETSKLELLKSKLEKIAEKELNKDMLIRKLVVDMELPLEKATYNLWQEIQKFAPFGMGNYEPVFVSRGVKVSDARVIGKDKKHLKISILCHVSGVRIDAIGFGMGELYSQLKPEKPVDIAYTIDINVWNGHKTLQLKLKDIHF